jgi:hypothetical protein
LEEEREGKEERGTVDCRTVWVVPPMSVLMTRGAQSRGLPEVVITEEEDEDERVEHDEVLVAEAEEKAPEARNESSNEGFSTTAKQGDGAYHQKEAAQDEDPVQPPSIRAC